MSEGGQSPAKDSGASRAPDSDQPLIDARSTTQSEAGRAWIWRVLESAGVFALVTAVVYFMGYGYYAGYFARLSFPTPYPDLGTSEYVIRAFGNFIGYLFLIFVVSSSALKPRKPVSRRDAWDANALFALVSLALLASAYSGRFLNWTIGLLLGGVIVVAIVETLMRSSVTETLASMYGIAAGLYYGILFVWFAGAYFSAQGTRDAERLLDGTLAGGSMVTLTMQDADSEFNDQSYILALYHGDNYYVIDPTTSIDQRPTALVIPDAAILAAEVRPIAPDSFHATPVAPSPLQPSLTGARHS